MLAPALVYLAVRQIGLLVLVWMSSATGGSTTAALTSWDGQWFLGLAGGGYDGVSAEMTDRFGRHGPSVALAFFPGYPALVAAVAELPGVGTTAAALTVAVVSGIAFSYGLVRLAEHVPGGSRRAGLVLVALVAAAPMGVVFSMGYSEATFCALAAWALVGVLRRQWVMAGACCLAAGLVRPTAAALIAAVGLAALVAIVRRRDSWRPWVAAALAPLGLAAYLGFVALRTGEWSGWFTQQRRGWDLTFDGGASTLRFTRDVLVTAPSVLEVVTVAVLAGAVALLVMCALAWVGTPAWPLVVYAVGVLVMDLGTGGLTNTKARLLLPAFVLLVPVAIGLARRRPSTAFAVLGAVVMASSWFGAYSLTVWPYAI
ncbi:MAG: hypothetical protein LC799_21230 [Actinobacteria bacterium]|nr:hypothetical protein [Actinomycetota bacterium]